MIWSVNFVADDVVCDIAFHDALGSEEVVETPANVSGARVHHISPEGVRLFLKVKTIWMPKM